MSDRPSKGIQRVLLCVSLSFLLLASSNSLCICTDTLILKTRPTELRVAPSALLRDSCCGHASKARRRSPPDPAPRREKRTNLRGVAAYAARWGGMGRTTGIGFLHRPSLQRAPSTRARSRGTQGSHPTTSGELTSRGSRRRGNSVH